MTRAFTLKRERDITPSCGEDLGAALARLAEGEIERLRAIETASVAHWAGTVAQMLYLAAEAFRQGASVSIGHKRSDRYEQRAWELDARAVSLEAEAKQQRDEHESRKLLAAFDDGYAARDIKHHSFERREAALVGQLFAQGKEPRPGRINKIYSPRPLNNDSPPDHLLVDDMKFIIVYPEGNTNMAFAKPIA